MKDYTTRVELMAIPIVAVIFGIGLILLLAGSAGPAAWLLVGIGAVLLVALLLWVHSRRTPHRAALTEPPRTAAGVATGHEADASYRVLVIADESCVDSSFAAQLSSHATGRSVEVLVIAPAIGSWLARWTNDEGAHAEARKHLDQTVTALARAGIVAKGETGADDPLQAADDGLREFAAHEIVFVTKPGTSTDWAERRVVELARARYSVPVVHIELPR